MQLKDSAGARWVLTNQPGALISAPYRAWLCKSPCTEPLLGAVNLRALTSISFPPFPLIIEGHSEKEKGSKPCAAHGPGSVSGGFGEWETDGRGGSDLLCVSEFFLFEAELLIYKNSLSQFSTRADSTTNMGELLLLLFIFCLKKYLFNS